MAGGKTAAQPETAIRAGSKKKQRTSAGRKRAKMRAICARPASCCLADSSSRPTPIQSTLLGSYYPAKGTRCLWFMDGSAWLNTGLQPLMSRLPRLPIYRWTSMKMLFRSGSPSVSCMVWYGGRQRVCTWSILDTHTKNKTCTKARPNGAGLPCYSAATDIPAVGICTCTCRCITLAG